MTDRKSLEDAMREHRERTHPQLQAKRAGVRNRERRIRRARGRALDYDALDTERRAKHGVPDEG